MLSITTSLRVDRLSGLDVTGFLSTCDDERYRQWWPGTHLQLHTVQGEPGQVGSLVFMDEYIGDERHRMTGEVMQISPGKKIVWQVRWWRLRLPVRLVLDLQDDDDGVRINHSIHAGYAGIGRILDPLFRSWFSPAFQAAMDAHVRTEFPKLRDLLRSDAALQE